MRAECPERRLLSPCASFLWVFITAEGTFLMQPAPPSPSSGWGPGLRARPLVEFAARCPNVGAPVRCLGCRSFPKWLHQARLQPRLTPARPRAEPGWLPLGPAAPTAPDSRPQGQRHRAGGPPCAPLPEAGGSVSPREDRAVSEPPASPPAPPGAAPSPEQRDPGPRPPPPARCGSPTRCRTRTSARACSSALNPGKIGLVLSLALTLTLTGMFQCCVRQSIEAENMMISVERGIEYTECEKEALWEYNFQPPPAWPHRGVIDSYNVNFRYSLDEPLVMKDLIPCIFSSEKVGIVGRTGAGKSSLIAALLRLSEPEGRILIDDIWTTEIGLHDLRKKMTVAPQEPVLFTGTMRKNLDPFNEHMDVELWKVLEEVQLKEAIEGLPGKMNAELAESGLNLSSGQRELVCLARAILRENRILIIDKATSNVDPRFWIQGDWKNMMNHLFCCKIETVCFTRRCNNWARWTLLPSLKGQNRCTLKGNSQILQ